MRLKLPLFLLPPDTFERHHIVARHLKRSGVKSVLDVGGEGLLKRFLPGVKCLAVNVDDSGDAQYDGSTIPFASSAFEAVVSLDTIEHLPAAHRQHFVDELLRVTQKTVVLSAPFGSSAHSEIEREALALYRRVYDKDHQYLREHVENGLPDVAALEALFRGFSHQMFFCGDCRQQFARFVSRCERGVVSQSRARDLLDIVRDANYWRRHELSDVASGNANRVYVFADVTNASHS